MTKLIAEGLLAADHRRRLPRNLEAACRHPLEVLIPAEGVPILV